MGSHRLGYGWMGLLKAAPAAALALAFASIVACSAVEAPTHTPPPTAATFGLNNVPAVKPLEDILVGAVTFADLKATSVTVLVKTSVPVVCAAAYGLTGQYGQLTTDSDMAGAGHRDHHPSLANLLPGTVYHVRLQGVGPDGSLYQSKDYTIRTPPRDIASAQPSPTALVDTTKPAGDNWALAGKGAKVAGVSSNYGGAGNASAFGANKAIDGDPATQWSSNGDGDKAWIEIALPSETQVSTIGFQTRTMGSSAQIFTFQVTTDRGQTFGPFTLPDAARLYYFQTDFRATKVRFEALQTSGGNTGAAEIEVYGILDPDLAGM